MQSNYSKIGPYIRRIDQRNVSDKKENLLGVSVSKVFMKSIANTVGTDFRTYKIVKRGQFTYIPDTSRRGEKIGIALLDSYDEGLVSPVYTVFEVSDTDKLDPEYLMMWFRRPEFDRYARFISHGSVREVFEWEDMKNVSLPLPAIEKQREIVAEYHTIQKRITINNQLIQTLETTAQAIYKQWFVEFEFPNEAGQSYKSSGGELVESELGEIPKGWEVKRLEELTKQICVAFVGSVFEYYCTKEIGVPMLRTTNVTKSGVSYKDLKYVTKEFHARNKKSQLKKGHLLVSRHGDNGMPIIFNEEFEANALNVIIIKPDATLMNSKLIHCFLTSASSLEHIQSSVGGSVQDVLNTKKISDIKIAYPADRSIVKSIAPKLETIQTAIDIALKQKDMLEDFSSLLLSKLATIESTTPAPAANKPAQLTLAFA